MTQITTPVGRIVWGNPLKSRIKMNQNVNPPTPALDATGQKINQWSFGVAFNKQEYLTTIWPIMVAEAQKLFPQAPQGVPAGFAWKHDDGDGVDSKGKPFRDREGYAGNWVLKISTEAFAPKVLVWQNGSFLQLTEGVKTGDFVRMSLDIISHGTKPGTQSKPGLYINPQFVQLVGAGTEIYNGPDPMDVLGNQQFAMPAGATPIGAPPAPQGNLPAMPGMPPQQPQMPGMPAQQPGFPQGMPQQPPQTPPMQPAVPSVPGAVPPGMPPASMPGQPAGYPSPTAYPSNPVAPDPTFVQGVLPQQPQTPAAQPQVYQWPDGNWYTTPPPRQ